MGLKVNDIATPSSGKSWDPEVGDTIDGTITLWRVMSPKPNFNKNALEREVRIDLADDNGEVSTVWMVVDTDVEGAGYPSRLARAVAAAVREACGDDGELEEGGRLAIQRIQDGEPPQRGFKPPKEYVARYTPPTSGVNLTSLMGGEAKVQPAGTNTFRPVPADPFAGLQGEPVHPKILPQYIDRACAIFGLAPAELERMTPANLADLIQGRGLDVPAAVAVLEGLYGDRAVALAAVAAAEPVPVDPLSALLGR